MSTGDIAKICLLLAWAALCILSSTDRAQEPQKAAGQNPTLPDTPAAKQLAAWLEALNAKNADTQRRFLTERYAASAQKEGSVEGRLRDFDSIYNDTHGLTLLRVEKSEENAITAFARTNVPEKWLRIRLKTEPQAPHGITEMELQPLFIDEEAEGKEKLSDAEIVKRLNAYFDRLAKDDAFSGAVLFAKDGKVLYKKAFGLASRAYNVPNRTDTKFNLASMGKMFTSVAIAQLVEQGKLSYTDTVGKILPDYPNKDVAAKVTVHHLLTHTAGIGDYFNEKFMEASRTRFRQIKDYFPLFVDKPLEFEPGARFRYSNAGFMVLGAIIEKVSGENYFIYVREHIFKPAGMINTDAYELDQDTPNLAIGYTREEPGGPVRNNTFLHVIKGGPAGGSYSTVEDLLRFDQALRRHRLTSSAAFDLITTGKVDAFERKYAYGFGDARVNGQRIVGHSGGFPGISTQLDMYLDSGYTVVVMCNDDDGAQRVAEKTRNMLTRTSVTAQK
jgi:CubicO group peptidase (beta-lactamase class C family)